MHESQAANINNPMKYTHLIPALLICLLCARCVREYKVQYNIPPNITDATREKLMKTLNEGKELYKANCTECHGIFTKGKDKVPNFTNEQIDNYSARFIRRDPKNHAVVIKMSPQQLNEVLTFLKYKKPKDSTAVVHPANRFRRR